MRNYLFLFALSLIVFASCGEKKPTKKVVVMSSGKMQVDQSDPSKINFTPGGQHNELTLELPSEKNTVSVKITEPAGEKSFEVQGDGLFVINLKTDTIVGGIVNYGSSGIPSNISTEQLEQIIDSTQKLLLGQNTSDEKKTFQILPMAAKKLSSNSTENVIGPHSSIPGTVEVDKDGKAPVYYKFDTNSQKRVALKKMLERMSK